ncbi:MAG TPA: restriction endonuclease, SacI family [Solirubrobacteraceae bacterium]|nr:restriction endonuclease, SacI family [Solirubrobacteraceae bacterium]
MAGRGARRRRTFGAARQSAVRADQHGGIGDRLPDRGNALQRGFDGHRPGNRQRNAAVEGRDTLETASLSALGSPDVQYVPYVWSVAESIDQAESLCILEAAATVAASRKPVPKLWEQRTRELAEMRTNKGAIAVLGTALLAKATNPAIDPLSLHEDSGRNGYGARTLAREVLAQHAGALGYALGTQAPDPLAGSPWFGPLRIDHITKWRKSARAHADKLIGWLSTLQADDAASALAAFLRVRMEVAEELRQQRAASFVGDASVDLAELVRTLEPFVTLQPEEGRRGVAATAAAFAAAGWRVEARIVNDPGQTDVDVCRPDGTVVMGVEVKQKGAGAQDALDVAAGALAAGASKALLCALHPEQQPLDESRLRYRAETDHAVAVEIVYSVDELLRLALYSSDVSRTQLLSRFPEEMADQLSHLEASPEAQARWRAAADRWTH